MRPGWAGMMRNQLSDIEMAVTFFVLSCFCFTMSSRSSRVMIFSHKQSKMYFTLATNKLQNMEAE